MKAETERRCKNEVECRKDKILGLSTYLHQFPEVAMEEFRAVQKIRAILQEEGFIILPELPDIPTAVAAYKKRGEGPRIGIVAEYDALPGIGHACGHNLIAAMSVGAALALGAVLNDYSGEIWLIGTPAEETAEGKVLLIEKGIFRNVDFGMMVHPGNVTIVAPVTLASISMRFEFRGKASHAATAPEAGINALDAVIQLFNSINALRQQIREDARIHGIISKGGDAANIIPEKASADIIVRSKDTIYCEELRERVKNCARGAALATGTKLNVTYFEGSCKHLCSNRKLTEIFREQLKRNEIEEFTGDTSGASTDMGNLSQIIPVVNPLLKVTKRKEPVAHHTIEYSELTGSDEVEDATMTGAKLLTLTGAEFLENPELIKEVDVSDFIHTDSQS